MPALLSMLRESLVIEPAQGLFFVLPAFLDLGPSRRRTNHIEAVRHHGENLAEASVGRQALKLLSPSASFLMRIGELERFPRCFDDNFAHQRPPHPCSF